MEEILIKAALTNGIWCALFVCLFLYTIYDSRKREIKYQETIKNLSKSLGIVDEIKKDVKDMKDKIFKNNERR